MKKEWTYEIELKTNKGKVLLWLGVTLFVLFMIWFIRAPIPASQITVNEVKVSGYKFIIDGSFKDKIARYKSYSIRTYSTGDVIITVYGGITVGGSRDIHIDAKASKKINAIYLYTPGKVRANKIWPPVQ